MSVQVEKLEKNMAKLTIEVSAAEFEKALEDAFLKNKNKISVPGFRKGKVPRQMVEKMYGPEIFYEDAANALIPDAYSKALDECEEDIVSSPEIDVTQIEKGKSFIFTATVALKPEVKLGKYKGVKVEAAEVTVTDEEVDAKIEKERENNARTIEVTDRPVKDGDMTVLDFEGFVDGVAFDGGKGENYPLTIGSGAFIPGFEEQLVGAEIGKEVEVNVTFPEDYQAEELKGKAAVFKCTIKEIKEKELPALDDEFASEVSDFETLDEYKEDIKSKAAEKKQKDAENEKENKLIEKVIENAKMDVADAQVADVQERIKDEFAQNLQYQGINLEQYMQICNITEEALMERIKPDAEKRIKSRLVLEAIAAAENIEVSDDEVHEELEAMAKQYQMNVEDIEGFMGDAEKDSIKKDLAVKKAVKVVVDNAKEV